MSLILVWKSFAVTNCLKCGIHGLEMLCQAFTTGTFSCCLFVDVSVFRFAFMKWRAALLGSDQVTDLAAEEYPNSLPYETPGLLLQCGLGHYPFTLWCFAEFGWIQAESTRQSLLHFFYQQSVNVSGVVHLAAVHGHIVTLPPPWLTVHADHELLPTLVLFMPGTV